MEGVIDSDSGRLWLIEIASMSVDDVHWERWERWKKVLLHHGGDVAKTPQIDEDGFWNREADGLEDVGDLIFLGGEGLRVFHL